MAVENSEFQCSLVLKLRENLLYFKPQWSPICTPAAVTLKTILRSADTVHLCVLCGSENKQRLFPYTALTDWFV